MTGNMRFKLLVVSTAFTLTFISSSLIAAQRLNSNPDLRHYESMFGSIPNENDPSWQSVPVEEWEKTFHFLADSANSNLERLLTWNASYNLVTGSDLTTISKTSSVIKEHASKFPSYYVMKQRYSFYRDNEKDNSFISLARQGELTFYNDQYEKEDYDNLDSLIAIKSNLKAILTPDHLLLYEYDRDSRRLETLQQLGYEEFGKKCEVLPPDSRCIGRSGTIFDPQFFFFQDLKPRFKYWTDLEHGLLLELHAYQNKTDDSVTQRVKVHKATIGGVDWVRIEYRSPNKDAPVSVHYFNSESGYNVVSYSFARNGIDTSVTKFEYENLDGVFIPKRLLYEYYKTVKPGNDSRKSFRYFDLIKAEINKPIPEEQFVMDALGLDDDAIFYDRTERNYYAYEKGKEMSEPIFRLDDLTDSVRSRAASTPLWRSPVRMTALCLGLFLIVFGVIYKVRRKRASS